jgi:hypothetical protein
VTSVYFRSSQQIKMQAETITILPIINGSTIQ